MAKVAKNIDIYFIRRNSLVYLRQLSGNT